MKNNNHCQKSKLKWSLVLSRIVWLLAVTLGLSSVALAHEDYAKKYRYHYISFANAKLPPGYGFFEPKKIDDLGLVYGNAFVLNEFGNPDFGSLAVYKDGVVTLYQGELLNEFVDVNSRGTRAGYIYNFDNADFITPQAALVRKGKLEAIPYLAGETYSSVTSINNIDTALIKSNVTGEYTYRLVENGKTLFDFQHIPDGNGFSWQVNNHRAVGGQTNYLAKDGFEYARAVRFRPPYYQPELLAPSLNYKSSIFYGINNCGNILGASTDFSKYRVGIWDKKGRFIPYFTKNGRGLGIFNNDFVVQHDGEYPYSKSYIWPKPGVRLNLKSLLDNPKAVEGAGLLSGIIGINGRGDMIGSAVICTATGCNFKKHFYFLKRLPVKTHKHIP